MVDHAANSPTVRVTQLAKRSTSSSDPWMPARHRIVQSPLWLLVPIVIFVILVLVLLVLPLTSPTDQSLQDRLAPPVTGGGSWSHPLGTDGLGRDVLARIAAGSLTSLQIAATASILAALIGCTLGIASGLLGGWIDRVLTLLSEVMLTVPSIVVGVVLTATLGQSLRNLIVILVIGSWISFARVLRLQARQIASSEFVFYSRSIGATTTHIGIRHLLPNLLPTVLVLFFQTLGGMMLWEASLTYLGLGARPDSITLGGIVRDGQEQIFNGWWISVFSGMTVAFAIIGFAFVGDWLRGHFERSRHQSA